MSIWKNILGVIGGSLQLGFTGPKIVRSGVDTILIKDKDNNAGILNSGGMTLSGPLELTGNGEVQKEITVGAASWHLGSSSPAEDFIGIGYTLLFDQNTEQHVHYATLIPSDYKAGSDIEITACWSFDTEEAGHYVIWELTYLSMAAGEDPAGAGTNIWQSSPVTTADGDISEDKLICTTFVTDLTGLSADDILILQFNRDANGTHGTDDLAQDARLHSIHLHYTADKLGA